MASLNTLDHSVHSVHSERRGMRALIFLSALKVMQSYRASSKRDIHSNDSKGNDLAFSEASESSLSYLCSRDDESDDDSTESQSETTQDVTQHSSASGIALEKCPSLYSKKRISRTTDSKSKGRARNLRRSSVRRSIGSLQDLDVNSCHSQVSLLSISRSSHRNRKYNSQDNEAGETDSNNSDGESLWKDSGSFACRSSLHSKLDQSQLSCGGSFHGEAIASDFELDLESSMETFRKPSARRSSGRRVTPRSKSLDASFHSSALHEIGDARRRNSTTRKSRPGPRRSKSLDLDTMNKTSRETSLHRLDSFNVKHHIDQPNPVRREGNENTPRRRVSRTKRRDHVTDACPSMIKIKHDSHLEMKVTSQLARQRSRQASSASSNRSRQCVRPSREINV